MVGDSSTAGNAAPSRPVVCAGCDPAAAERSGPPVPAAVAGADYELAAGRSAAYGAAAADAVGVGAPYPVAAETCGRGGVSAACAAGASCAARAGGAARRTGGAGGAVDQKVGGSNPVGESCAAPTGTRAAHT